MSIQNTSITTTLPYVNADPHIGFAHELVRADAYARYRALLGDAVCFNTGTDEHGQKIYENAQKEGVSPQEYVDGYAERFRELHQALDTSVTHFIRTTNPAHREAAQEFWRRCSEKGDIYKKNYTVKYCVGCELEKTDSELASGRCPLHPNRELELREEENYFFRFSAYQDALLSLYRARPDFVVPDYRLNEIRAFVERGLEDFSISRLREKMPWGVSVPDDPDHVMYVWFDALVNYISTLGWPDERYKEWWPSVQFAGKDNLRQQSAMWQAMLLSAGIAPSKQIVILGFLTSGGQKMSKSLGNVISPFTLIDEYGCDAVRYFLLREVHPFEDSDVTEERVKETYNANLANGLGNLVSRVMKLAEVHLDAPIARPLPASFPEEYTRAIESYRFDEALDYAWKRIGEADEKMTREEPFRVIKVDPEKAKQTIRELAGELYHIARLIAPALPETSRKIKDAVLANKKPASMFERKE